MNIAAGCLKYSDDLKVDYEKMSYALGIVLRLYQDKIRNLSVQELSLLIAFLSKIDEKYYEKYIDFFDKEKVKKAIETGKNSKEQMEFLEKNLECMNLSFYDYDLKQELIAQTPLSDRSSSKMLVLDKNTGNIEHEHFKDITDYFESGDCIVLNDTKVIPARLIGEKTYEETVDFLKKGNII